jgi:DNA-binding NtrC family response regulator
VSPKVVLIVEDEAAIREGLAAAVRRLGLHPVLAGGVREARAALAEHVPACVLLDMRLDDGDGLELLRELKRGPRRGVPVIIATAYGDGERTIAAMRDGAFDYLTKPFDLPVLLATVERAAKQQAATPAALEAEPPGDDEMVGRSAAMHTLRKLVGRAAATDDPVLVVGEPGTGKELAARAVHRFSSRAREPLSVLRGDAREPAALDKALGAKRGVLIIEDVDTLSRDLQRVLAQRLERGAAVRVLGTARERVHRPDGPLLDELYFRLAVIEIEVPPLRARRSDIPLLVAYALIGSAAGAVSEEAMLHLLGRDWPGNVRELFHVVRRAAALCDGEIIDVPHLPGAPASLGTPPTANPYAEMPMREAVGALERDLLRAALEKARGNRTVAAKLLGIARPQLYAKLDEHGLSERKER